MSAVIVVEREGRRLAREGRTYQTQILWGVNGWRPAGPLAEGYELESAPVDIRPAFVALVDAVLWVTKNRSFNDAVKQARMMLTERNANQRT